MLGTLQVLVANPRHIECHLPRRMRVEFTMDLIYGELESGIISARPQQVSNTRKVFGGEHFWLRKNQTEHWIVRNIFPMDQMIDNVLVNAEGQYLSDNPDRETQIRGKVTKLRDVIDVAMSVDSKRHGVDRSRINAEKFSWGLQVSSISHRIIRAHLLNFARIFYERLTKDFIIARMREDSI